jgi:hypothetical protein
MFHYNDNIYSVSVLVFSLVARLLSIMPTGKATAKSLVSKAASSVTKKSLTTKQSITKTATGKHNQCFFALILTIDIASTLGACIRCKQRKKKCVFPPGSIKCKDCINGKVDCEHSSNTSKPGPRPVANGRPRKIGPLSLPTDSEGESFKFDGEYIISLLFSSY